MAHGRWSGGIEFRPMPVYTTRALGLAIAAALVVTLSAQEPVDRAMIEKIRREGLDRSQAPETFNHLVTVIGPRLTGSPAHKAAAAWARDRFAAAGLANAHLEPWEFGRGWELTKFTVEMTAPRYMPLIGYPEAWSTSTAGEISAAPIFIGDMSAEQVEGMKDRLEGAIVLTQPMQTGFVRADRTQPTATTERVTICLLYTSPSPRDS